MSPNILTAIKNISDFKTNNMSEYLQDYATTQVKTVRQQMEYYMKDAISGSFKSVKDRKPTDRYNGVFSYIGSKNKPPDMIIQGGDALVIKTTKKMMAPKPAPIIGWAKYHITRLGSSSWRA